jgi:hypothetical protein
MLSSGSRSLFSDFCPEHEFSRVGPASNEAAATAPVFKKSLLSDIVLAIIELKHDFDTNIAQSLLYLSLIHSSERI